MSSDDHGACHVALAESKAYWMAMKKGDARKSWRCGGVGKEREGACVSAGHSGGRAKGGGVAFILTCAVAYTTSHVPSCAVVSKFSCCCARSASMMRLASSARSLYSRLICPRSVVAAILVVWATTSSMSERECV